MMLTKVNFQKDVESFTHLLERETKFRLSVLGGGDPSLLDPSSKVGSILNFGIKSLIEVSWKF